MKIISADITGSLIINNQDVTTTVESSSIWSGSIASRVTDLEQFSSSLDATFATDQQLNQATASLSGSIALLSSSYLATSQSYDIVSSSYSAASGSFSTRVTTLEEASSSLNTASGSFSTRVTTLEAASSSLNTASGSFSTRVTNNEATGSSLTTASGSFSTRVTTIESKYATTGSNTYTGPQYVSHASNAISFTSTASLYTDGGLRVTKDAFVSGTMYLNNLTVYGTSSIQYATSSQLNVGTNIISVNTNTPILRFGGLAVYDSGSTNLTGSILWDSEDNQWIYSNPSGSTYDSAVFLVGPRNSAVLGNEVGINCNFLSKGNGMHHMTSSAIFDDGSRTCFYGSSIITSTGVGCFSGAVCAASVASTGTITGTTIYGSTAICGGTVSGTTGTFSSSVTAGSNIILPSGFELSYGNGNVSILGNTSTNTMELRTNNSTKLTIASTGAATFSSTVTGTTLYGSTAICGGTVSGTTGTFSSCVAGTQLYADSSTNSIIQSTINTNSNCCAIISARWSGGAGIRMYYHPNSAVSVIENTYQAEAGQVYGDILFRHNVGGTQTTRLRLQADGGIACFVGTVCAPTFVGGIYYDSANTGYYLDPASTSNLYRMTMAERITVGTFPSSTTNTGEAWFGRASDRNQGTFTIQLGGSSASNRQFEVVDYAWSVVLASVSSAGTLSASGDVVAYASDCRLKQNVVPITGALSKIKCINGVSYTWKDGIDCLGFTPSSKQDVGVLAQEIQKVLPEVVKPAPFDQMNGKSKSGENYLTVKYEKIVPLLIEAIKEQQCQIEYLKSKIG